MKSFEKDNYDVFHLFNRQWGLLTCGNKDAYNCMTVSWGSLGSLFGDPNLAKPVATVYINETRYTTEFMHHNDIYTISFFPEACKHDLALLGETSGRDKNKLALTKLTPKFSDEFITYEEAHTTLICRKLFSQPMDGGHLFDDEVKEIFAAEPPYCMFIGEIMEIR